jgi:hypothetical protein
LILLVRCLSNVAHDRGDIDVQRMVPISQRRDDRGYFFLAKGVQSRPRAFELFIQTLIHLECWKDCIAQLVNYSHPDPGMGRALLRFWETYGLSSIPHGLKSDLPIFVDALRRHLPTYRGHAITLYRGELEARHLAGIYGISWTSKPKIASQLADRRNAIKEGTGVVLRIDASSEMIVADHTMLVGPRAEPEREYIIDPRMIRSVSVVPRYDIPGADDPW